MIHSFWKPYMYMYLHVCCPINYPAITFVGRIKKNAVKLVNNPPPPVLSACLDLHIDRDKYILSFVFALVFKIQFSLVYLFSLSYWFWRWPCLRHQMPTKNTGQDILDLRDLLNHGKVLKTGNIMFENNELYFINSFINPVNVDFLHGFILFLSCYQSKCLLNLERKLYKKYRIPKCWQTNSCIITMS